MKHDLRLKQKFNYKVEKSNIYFQKLLLKLKTSEEEMNFEIRIQKESVW